MRILKSHPLLKLVNSYVIDASQPTNISYLWNFGSLLLLCLVVQIISGIFLAMFNYFCFSMFFPVVNLMDFLGISICFWNIILTNPHTFCNTFVCYSNDATVAASAPNINSSCKTLKDKILAMKTDNNNNKPMDQFLEWFRGFTDAEGYFSINLTSRKDMTASGEPVTYHSVNFSFIIHLALKDIDVLRSIQRLLGGIGNIQTYGSSVRLNINKKEDLDKLLGLMFDYFCKLNSTKVLDFLAWYKAFSLYYRYLESRDKSFSKYKDPLYTDILNKVRSIKDSMNRARVDFKLPENHQVIITKEWLLGFIEGEGCFYVNKFSVGFKIAQTAVNKYILLHIKYFLSKYGDNLITTVVDCKPNSINQKPYAELFIGKSNNTALIFISLLIDLSWLSIKRFDFIYWTLIYILVFEGKHILPEGKDIIAKLKSKMGLNSSMDNQNISKETLDLILSDPNYIESDQTGIWKVKVNHKGLISIGHKQGSYVLVSSTVNTETLKFKSNAECALHFKVSPVTVGRWIQKKSPILTKRGVYLFQKRID